MTQVFAGVFDRTRAAPLRLRLPAPGRDADSGVLCLLDGAIDDREQLAVALGLAPSAPTLELLSAGYRRWGQELPSRLRGDFALVIWDGARGRGLIARDQLGVRCVYLAERAGGLCFASELHLLLELLPATPAPDRASVAHWIAASARPGSETLFAGVRRLNPGAMVLLEAADSRGAREEAYWRPRYREPSPRSGEECAREARLALERAVDRRLHGVERAGVLMSGGLDSASVAGLARRTATEVRAYAGVFPEHPSVDESDLIAVLRESLDLPGIDARVGPGGLVGSALAAAAAWRLPLLGWGDAWTVPLLRAAASEGVALMLGGDGGDEVFGVRAQLLADLLRGGHPLRALATARRLPGAGPLTARAAARVLVRFALPDAAPRPLAQALRRAGAGSDPPAWLLPATRRALADSDDPLAWMRLDGPRWWAHAAHGLTRGIEERGIFEHQRLRAAQVGLQARHPLLDLDLLELALGLPADASFDAELNRPVLRAAMAGLLPDVVRLRARKAWFDTLILDSLAGSDAAGVRALLLDPRAELGAYVDLAGVRATLDAGPPAGPGRFRWMHLVWRLLTVECWLRALGGDARDIPISRARVELCRVSGEDEGLLPFSTSSTHLGDLR